LTVCIAVLERHIPAPNSRFRSALCGIQREDVGTVQPMLH
jgi:hypothetical protein